MNKEALEALRGSIEKWEHIVAGDGADRGSSNCSLCQIFFDRDDGKPECFGCPVMVASGQPLCKNTPYDGWMLSQEGSHTGRAVTLRQIAAAKNELKFLKSLLPK